MVLGYYFTYFWDPGTNTNHQPPFPHCQKCARTERKRSANTKRSANLLWLLFKSAGPKVLKQRDARLDQISMQKAEASHKCCQTPGSPLRSPWHWESQEKPESLKMAVLQPQTKERTKTSVSRSNFWSLLHLLFERRT